MKNHEGDKFLREFLLYTEIFKCVCPDQVTVFGALNNGDFASMADARLYLPEVWCTDSARCNEAGIPEEALSARDIKRWILLKLHRQISEEEMIDQMFERHRQRQRDINRAFDWQEYEIC